MKKVQNGTGALVPQSMETAEVPNAFITSVFTRNNGLSGSSGPETRTKGWNKEDVSSVEKDQITKYLRKLDLCKSMDPDGIHPQVRRETTGINMRPFSRTFEYS